MIPHVETLGELLRTGTYSRDARLSGYCNRLYERFPMLWLFAAIEDVEPTNNHADGFSDGPCSGDRNHSVARAQPAVDSLKES